MPDAIRIFPPGWRALDDTGAVLSGAQIDFFLAGTEAGDPSFSDATLETTLPNPIVCDSGGYPASNGNAKVTVWRGSAPYRVRMRRADGTVVFDHDDQTGALDTSPFLTSGELTPQTPITNIAIDESPTAADAAAYYNVNCSGGTVSINLPAASGLENGWYIKARHDGTANAVVIVANGSDVLKIGNHAGVSSFSLTDRGAVATITCDGTGFKVEQSSPSLFNTVGVIRIADRLSAPPVSPATGARYILTTTPTGDWNTYAEHDIVEKASTGWFKITPPSDCGWIAYVADEDQNYQFIGSAWVAAAATTSRAGSVQLADQAAMEGLTAGRAVTAEVQHFHPGHPKFWAYVTVSGGTPTLAASYNVTSITDDDTGQLTVTIANDFSSNNWACLATTMHTSGGNLRGVMVQSKAAGSVTLKVRSSGDFSTDPDAYSVAGFGDL